MKKNVKFLIFGSYFAVLLVFILIFLWVNGATERGIKELYTEKRAAAVDQTMLAVDEQVDGIRRMFLNLSQEPYVQYFSYVGPELSANELANSVKLIGAIGRHYTANPFVLDYFIYYSRSGRIASAGGFYRAEDYFRLEWTCEDAAEQAQLRERMEAKETAFLPAVSIKNGGSRAEVIPYICRLGGAQREDASVFVAFLKCSWLDGMTASVVSDGGEVVIRAGDGMQTLYSQTGDAAESRDDFISVSMTSETTGWVYESRLPYRVIKEQVRQTSKPLFAGILLYVVVGVPVCLFFGRRSYAPIHHLSEKYAELEAKYGNAVESYDTAAGILARNKERIEEGTLRQLLNGGVGNTEKLAERLAGTEIVFPHAAFLTVLARLEHVEEAAGAERELLVAVLRRFVRERLASLGEVYTIPYGRDGAAVIVNTPDARAESTAAESLIALCGAFEAESGVQVSAGVGTLCSSPELLHESFRAAQKNLDYVFILGAGSVIAGSMSGNGAAARSYLDVKLEQRLFRHFSRGEGSICRSLLEGMYEDAAERRISIGEGKWLQIFLADVCMKAVDTVRLDRRKEEDCQEVVGRILESGTLPEAVKLAADFYEEFCGSADAEPEEGLLAKRAVQWIGGNFWKPDFSQQACAEALGVSPEHLSRTLKTEKGQTFTDIVGGFRLERAKKYLLETDKKLEEIAVLSGYGTANSFFRNFKAAEGVTPGEWRKSARRE